MGQADASGILAVSTEERCNGVYAPLLDFCWTVAGQTVVHHWTFAGQNTQPLASAWATLFQDKDSDRQRHMATDTTFKRLMARPRKGGHGGRTEAYAWLRVRFEKLSPRLRNRPGWRGIAEDMAGGGIKGGNDKPLTARAIMRIWPRVCQDVAAEEPWRVDAVRIATLERELVQNPRNRESERGKDADRPPPVLATPAPRPPVPHYPPPPTMPPAQSAMHSRPNAPPIASGAKQTPEEMRADIRAIIRRRSQYF